LSREQDDDDRDEDGGVEARENKHFILDEGEGH
jgi:hypothetical protein